MKDKRYLLLIIQILGLQYFTDYLRYLKMYVPDYVATNMNVEQRIQEIDQKSKDKNSMG